MRYRKVPWLRSINSMFVYDNRTQKTRKGYYFPYDYHIYSLSKNHPSGSDYIMRYMHKIERRGGGSKNVLLEITNKLNPRKNNIIFHITDQIEVYMYRCESGIDIFYAWRFSWNYA